MLERIDIFNVCNLYSWLQYDSHTTPRPSLLSRICHSTWTLGEKMRWQRSLHLCGRIANWSLQVRLPNHPARLPGEISVHTHGTNCAAWPEERALKKQHVVVRVPLRSLMPFGALWLVFNCARGVTPIQTTIPHCSIVEQSA